MTTINLNHSGDDPMTPDELAIRLERAKEKTMARRPKQDEMFPQKKIAEIETYADRYDDAREAKAVASGNMENAELKVSELMHKHEDKLSHEENKQGERMLVYRRGDYRVQIVIGERLNVKIGEKSKGESKDDDTDGSQSGGGDSTE